MKKILSAFVILVAASSFVFADWDKSINVGVGLPVFNQKYEDGLKLDGVGVGFDAQVRFVNNANNYAFLVGYNVGYLSVDNLMDDSSFNSANKSAAYSRNSTNSRIGWVEEETYVEPKLEGVTNSIIGGFGYRFVSKPRVQMIVSALAGLNFVNLSYEGKSVDYSVFTFDFELGADILAQLFITKHFGLSASCSALLTVAGSGQLDATVTVGSTSASGTKDFDVKPGSFIFVPRVALTYRF